MAHSSGNLSTTSFYIHRISIESYNSNIIINRVRIKCFFKNSARLYFLGFAPIHGFLPTQARQLGYSVTTFGAVMTIMSMISTVVVPLCGIAAERFYKRKLFYFVSVLLVGLSSFLFVFVPKVPLKTVVKLQCDEANVLAVDTESVVSATFPDGTVNNSTDEFVCNVRDKNHTYLIIIRLEFQPRSKIDHHSKRSI